MIQLRSSFWGRVELDTTILRILGFSENEIKRDLPNLYNAVAEDLSKLKEERHTKADED